MSPRFCNCSPEPAPATLASGRTSGRRGMLGEILVGVESDPEWCLISKYAAYYAVRVLAGWCEEPAVMDG